MITASLYLIALVLLVSFIDPAYRHGWHRLAAHAARLAPVLVRAWDGLIDRAASRYRRWLIREGFTPYLRDIQTRGSLTRRGLAAGTRRKRRDMRSCSRAYPPARVGRSRIAEARDRRAEAMKGKWLDGTPCTLPGGR